MNNSPVKTIRFMPEDMSAEIIFDTIIDCVKSGEIGLVVIDSLNMLVPDQVFGESF